MGKIRDSSPLRRSGGGDRLARGGGLGSKYRIPARFGPLFHGQQHKATQFSVVTTRSGPQALGRNHTWFRGHTL